MFMYNLEHIFTFHLGTTTASKCTLSLCGDLVTLHLRDKKDPIKHKELGLYSDYRKR
jgi:hypothetical protein